MSIDLSSLSASDLESLEKLLAMKADERKILIESRKAEIEQQKSLNGFLSRFEESNQQGLMLDAINASLLDFLSKESHQELISKKLRLNATIEWDADEGILKFNRFNVSVGSKSSGTNNSTRSSRTVMYHPFTEKELREILSHPTMELPDGWEIPEVHRGNLRLLVEFLHADGKRDNKDYESAKPVYREIWQVFITDYHDVIVSAGYLPKIEAFEADESEAE